MNKRFTIRLLMTAALLAGFAATPQSADAGGFLKSRPRIFNLGFRRTNTNSNWNRNQTRSIQSSPRIKNYSAGGNDWPGAIGTPSHRYLQFQDINGYWR